MNPNEIVWKFPEELAVGTYANAIRVESTGSDFTIDFAILIPPTDARVVQRIRIPPSLALDFAQALGSTLDKHEKIHGEIPNKPITGMEPPMA